MSKKESHPIRNGIIATVVGGLILTFVPQFRSVAIKVLDWAWSGLTWVWSSFLSTYSISGWVLLLIGALACTGLIAIYYLLQEYFNPEHKKYTEDFFHGAKWSGHG